MIYVYLTLVLVVGFGLGFWVRKKTFKLPPAQEPPKVLPNVIFVETFEPTLLPPPEPELPPSGSVVGRTHLRTARRTRLGG